MTNSTNINNDKLDLNINLPNSNTNNNHDGNDVIILNNKLSFGNKKRNYHQWLTPKELKERNFKIDYINIGLLGVTII